LSPQSVDYFLYITFISGGRIPHRSFRSAALAPWHSIGEEAMLDLIFLALGLGMFGLLSLYAMAVNRL
jgi:hypothetical protein